MLSSPHRSRGLVSPAAVAHSPDASAVATDTPERVHKDTQEFLPSPLALAPPLLRHPDEFAFADLEAGVMSVSAVPAVTPKLEAEPDKYLGAGVADLAVGEMTSVKRKHKKKGKKKKSSVMAL